MIHPIATNKQVTMKVSGLSLLIERTETYRVGIRANKSSETSFWPHTINLVSKYKI